MKIHGKKLSGPSVQTIVFPREEGDIVIRARGVPSMSDFNSLCPNPKPPEIIKPGGEVAYNVKDKTYIATVEQHSEMRTNWLCIQSLKATPGLEWEKVKEDDPTSWGYWRQEFQDCGFAEAEVLRIVNLVLVANSLDDSKLEEARRRFLASQEKQPVA